MSEVAVAVFHIDKREADSRGVPRRPDELVHQAIELVVAEAHGVVADCEPLVENGMPVRDAGARSRCTGPCESAGVRQLQADDEVAGVSDVRGV